MHGTVRWLNFVPPLAWWGWGKRPGCRARDEALGSISEETGPEGMVPEHFTGTVLSVKLQKLLLCQILVEKVGSVSMFYNSLLRTPLDPPGAFTEQIVAGRTAGPLPRPSGKS